jgi:hypothetical protein
MRLRDKCPPFSGKEDDFDDWRNKLEDWLILEEGNIKYPGLEIRVALKGKAYDLCKDIDRKELMKEDGKKEILKILDKTFKKDGRLDKMEKAMKLYKIEKQKEETMKEYVTRYETYSRECEKAGGGKMTEEMKGSHLLGQANLTNIELHIVLGACGEEEYEFEKIKTSLMRIFQEKDKSTEKEEKKTWIVQETDKENTAKEKKSNKQEIWNTNEMLQMQIRRAPSQ